MRTRYRHQEEAETAEEAARQTAEHEAMEIDRHEDEDEDIQDADAYPQEYIGPQAHEFNGHDIYGRGLGARSDYGPSEGSDTGDGWDALDTPPRTPPPIPPRTPTPPPGDDEPEDDFARITAEDYREYDRWFGEDQAELDEIVLEMLTEEEIDSIKMTAIRLFGHLSEGNYERIRYSFRNKVQFLSSYRIARKLCLLSGVTPQPYDCCINVCYAFTGEYADLEFCPNPKCKKARYEGGKPVKTWEYLPMNPRLRGLFKNSEMVTQMYYRADYVQEAGAMDEYIDGTRYKRLTRSKIVIDGEELDAFYFGGSRDIAYAVMLDGVNIFERSHKETSTCWPILAINLNLPASERVKLRNIIPLGVIPGPNQPKDFNSFLLPFVEEAIEQARGLEAYDVTRGKDFTLRAHPIFISGDMQAIKHAMEMKGPNGKLPCRGCEGCGIYHKERKTYYLPLVNPTDKPDAIPEERIDPDAPADALASLDPDNLPLRTSRRIAWQLEQMDNARNKRQYNDLARDFGLAGHSILDRIPSISRPDSYPHEFLHLFLLNHGPELVSLWAGTYQLGDNDEYVLIADDWTTIGLETVEASKTLPALFIRPLPNIATCWRLYCGESWCFWLVYIGPIVLRGRLPKKYYDHYMELVNILKCLLSLSNTTARIGQLRHEIIHYVETFEELYYQYKYDRISVCKLTLHALLHVADDVLRCGPVWVAWSFVVERFCREVTFCAKSKVVPYKTISKHVLQMSQIAAIAGQFPQIRKALLFGKNDAPSPVSRMEKPLNLWQMKKIILFFGFRLYEFFLEPPVCKRLARFFCTNYPHQTYSAWLEFIPERCERWGKLRIAKGGDKIRASAPCNPASAYGKRDASFVRYVFQKDKNEDDPDADIEMVDAIGYGCLEFILAIRFPDTDKAKDFLGDTPPFHILAHVAEAKGVEGDGTERILTFTEFGRKFILDITSIKHLAGRVHTQGVRQGGEWAIVDRAERLANTNFQVDERGG
ncbi:transposase family Tnp2 protein, partial [Rhizoctonia solani 123E]